MRCALCSRWSGWPRWHLGGRRRCDRRNWTLRPLILRCWWRRDWSIGNGRRLSLRSRRGNVRCALCSRWPRWHLGGRRRCDRRNWTLRPLILRCWWRRDWSTGNSRRLSLRSRRGNVRCALCSRWDGWPHWHLSGGRRRWLLGRCCRSYGRSFCRSSRLFRRWRFRLLLGLYRLGEYDQRCRHGLVVRRSARRNAGLADLSGHDTGKNRASHE